jgi:hypothetical protein
MPRLVPLLALALLVPPASRADEPDKGRPHLRFLVLANEHDDRPAFDAAVKFFKEAATDDKAKADLQDRARKGLPPPPVRVGADKDVVTYSWVEVSPAEVRALRLDRPPRADGGDPQAALAEAAFHARKAGLPFVAPGRLLDRLLFYSRKCQDERLSAAGREVKNIDYFLLAREPAPDKAVTGEHLEKVEVTEEPGIKMPAVKVRLTAPGGDLFFALTDPLAPKGPDAPRRHLAVVVDGIVVAAPAVYGGLKRDAVLSGAFTADELDGIVKALQSDLKKK